LTNQEPRLVWPGLFFLCGEEATRPPIYRKAEPLAVFRQVDRWRHAIEFPQ